MRSALPRWGARLGICLGLALSARAAAQEHQHGAPGPEADPVMRVILEGPHLVLAHDGLIELTDEQLRELRLARSGVCAAQVAYVQEKTLARTELVRLLGGGTGESELQPVLDRLARAEAEWMRVLVRARIETLARLAPAQRQQVALLGDHWLREANAMIADATQPGHRGHPGMQLPIRVPGMVVAETFLAPFCEALHGPGVHMSMPPVPPPS